MDDLVEECLRDFHGAGDYGWKLITITWPAAAIAAQRKKMAAIIEKIRASSCDIQGPPNSAENSDDQGFVD